MTKTIPLLAAISVASCFALGCDPAPTDATISAPLDGSASTGTKTVTLYVPEMGEKLKLL